MYVGCRAPCARVRSRMPRPLVALLLLGAAAAPLAAQHFHRLPATPGTVAYGYYSAPATPVLRIASGDTVQGETLITNRPDRLEAAGGPPRAPHQPRRDPPPPAPRKR